MNRYYDIKSGEKIVKPPTKKRKTVWLEDLSLSTRSQSNFLFSQNFISTTSLLRYEDLQMDAFTTFLSNQTLLIRDIISILVDYLITCPVDMECSKYNSRYSWCPECLSVHCITAQKCQWGGCPLFITIHCNNNFCGMCETFVPLCTTHIPCYANLKQNKGCKHESQKVLHFLEKDRENTLIIPKKKLYISRRIAT